MLIVGASAGIGRAVGEQAQAAGARVVLAARLGAFLRQAAAACPSPCKTIQANVSNTQTPVSLCRQRFRISAAWTANLCATAVAPHAARTPDIGSSDFDDHRPAHAAARAHRR